VKFGLRLRYVVQANNFMELIPFCQMAMESGADDVTVYYLRNWGTFSDDEYRQRAVHLPEHPEHAAFSKVMSDSALASNPRVVLPEFPPSPLG
jgi:hypothetical protein